MPLVVLALTVSALGIGVLRSTPEQGADATRSNAPAVLPDGSPAPTPTPAFVRVPIRGGRYTEAVVGGVPTVINPLLAAQTDPNITALVFSGLTKLDGRGDVYGDLADQIDLDPQGRVYTFHIRPDATWHDGKPVTPQDVLFTVRLLQDPNFPGDPEQANLWRTVTVDLPGDGKEGRVRFTLKDRFAPFLGLTTLGILPQHLLGGIKAEDLPDQPFNLNPVGTGPYRFLSLEPAAPAANLVLYAKHYEVATDAAYFIQEMRFQYYPTFPQALDATRRGGQTGPMGIAEIPIAELFRTGAALNPQGARTRDWSFYGYDIAAYTALFYNNQSAIFSDRAVRQAADLAIDRKAIVRDVLGDQARPGDGPVLPNSWAYKPETAKHMYDQNVARQTLDMAGWRLPPGGTVRENNGQKLAFTLVTNGSDVRPQVAQAIATQLAAVGFEVQVNRIAVSAFELQQSFLVPRTYDAALFGFRDLLSDPDPYPFWHSTQAGSGYNFTDFRDTDSDLLLESGRRATNPTERRLLYGQFQDRFISEMPASVLYYPRYVVVVSSKVYGVQADTINVAADRFRGLSRWYLQYQEVSVAQATAQAPPVSLPPTAAPTYAPTLPAAMTTPGAATPMTPTTGTPRPVSPAPAVPAPTPAMMPAAMPTRAP